MIIAVVSRFKIVWRFGVFLWTHILSFCVASTAHYARVCVCWTLWKQQWLDLCRFLNHRSIYENSVKIYTFSKCVPVARIDRYISSIVCWSFRWVLSVCVRVREWVWLKLNMKFYVDICALGDWTVRNTSYTHATVYCLFITYTLFLCSMLCVSTGN